jgi:SAM-dependent methyltransferase
MLLNFAKKALAAPVIFDTYQTLIGAPECHRRFIQEMVRPLPKERILDVGCGVGASLRYLPDSIDYVGVDISKAYIAKAKANFSQRGRFINADITTLDAAALGTFDRAFCFGLLHHLSDDVVERTIELVHNVVKPGGAFLSIDPCIVPGQHAIARLIIDHDRGEHVRDLAGYERLLAKLGQVQTAIYNDLLRTPYTQIVMRVEVGGKRSLAENTQTSE